jgi:hypothetical protein
LLIRPTSLILLTVEAWAPGEIEVEIIPPKTRNGTGKRWPANHNRVDIRQKVNLAPKSYVVESQRFTYDAMGRPGRSAPAGSSRLYAYA